MPWARLLWDAQPRVKQHIIPDEAILRTKAAPLCSSPLGYKLIGRPAPLDEEFEVVIMIAVRDRRDAWVGPRVRT
jgi:hypothetical protein